MLTRDLANKIGLFFILTDNFLLKEFDYVDLRAQYVFYLIFILYYIFVRRTILVNTRQIVNILIVFCILSIVPLFDPPAIIYYVKQLAVISFTLLFAYLLINAYEYDFEKLFKDYIDLIFIASLVGIVQAISLALNFYYGANYSYLGLKMGNFTMHYTRLQSWFEEPSAMSLAFLPAVFVCLARLFRLTDFISLRKAIFITVMLISTQSTTGLIGFLIAFLIIVTARYSFLSKPHVVLAGFVLLAAFAYGFYSIPMVKIRVDDSAAVFFDRHVSSEDINSINLSTYALYTNVKVTMASFMADPIFGTGLGSRELTYENYIDTVVPFSNLSQYQLNRKDANSLLLRIISETGLFGLALTLWFIISNRIRLNLKVQTKEEITYWMFNSGALVLILARFLRLGHYTWQGFMLFILIYFFTKKHVQGQSPAMARLPENAITLI